MDRTGREADPAAMPHRTVPPASHRPLYLANATVLLGHQIDAAHWQEWTLFGLPGGIELFVVLNLPIVAVLLLGTARLEDVVGRRISAGVAASGVFAAVFHGLHLAAGDEAFRTPVSVALLVATAVLSPLQAACLWSLRREQRPEQQHLPDGDRVRL